MRNIHSAAAIGIVTDGLTSRVQRVVSRAWSGFWRRRSMKATIRVLNGLDDRMLKDIGIDRSEIESIASTEGQGRRRRYDVLIGPMRYR